MKFFSRYRMYLALNMVIVGVVIILFRSMSNSKTAGLIAGALFVLGPAAVIWFEVHNRATLRSGSFWGATVFLLASALPMYLLRITHWDEPFESLQWLGISGPQMHKLSTYFFSLMLIGIFIDSFRLGLKNKGPN